MHLLIVVINALTKSYVQNVMEIFVHVVSIVKIDVFSCIKIVMFILYKHMEKLVIHLDNYIY